MTSNESNSETSCPQQTGRRDSFCFYCLSKKQTFRIVIAAAAVGTFLLFATARMQTFEIQPWIPVYKSIHSVDSSLLSPMRGVVVPSNQSDSSRCGCKPVLERATYGKWVPRTYSAQEKIDVERFITRVRTYQKLPLSMQRKDSRCGKCHTVSYRNYHSLFIGKIPDVVSAIYCHTETIILCT
ncbi:hypothetical protein PoB_007616700 [Plakobranchus ocellatus]|uniref:Uncharacterized protein n=1 Tax=Plakobranchus ocellatus TaxID=259542 RepID=A0AAV4DZB5_9GAST|nr:hypothetical protein PoB_007616700 [Plakobranchus ocellatus]